MVKPPKDQTPLWVRDSEGFNERINQHVKQIGMKKADYLAQVIQHALEQENPLFFAERGTPTHRNGKRKAL